MAKEYLGLDLGSSFTKFVVIDAEGAVRHRAVIPTLSRRRDAFETQLEHIALNYNVVRTCSTGYGRNSVKSDLQKTELVAASAGMSLLAPMNKIILDIGGEDTKIIESGAGGEVLNFFMNDKCSAGTGSFITEIADKAELAVEEMSELATQSKTKRTMNSFCTVFAKSEILGWKFEGVAIEDMARGIYLSIVDRVAKMPLMPGLPLFMAGGVIAYHPYLSDLLALRLETEVQIAPEPQYIVALGAAVLARDSG